MHDFLLSQQFLGKDHILTPVNHIDGCHVTMAVFIDNQNVELAMEYNRAKYELNRLKAKGDIALCSFHPTILYLNYKWFLYQTKVKVQEPTKKSGDVEKIYLRLETMTTLSSNKMKCKKMDYTEILSMVPNIKEHPLQNLLHLRRKITQK